MLHAQVFVRDATCQQGEPVLRMCALRTASSTGRLAAQPPTLAENPSWAFPEKASDFPRSEGQQQAGSAEVDPPQ